ncbi:MAG: hypothetical protein HY675_01055 [Chloroflexi bacterium]|nr:hypothetical protein [Chloroflexota bacterium]
MVHDTATPASTARRAKKKGYMPYVQLAIVLGFLAVLYASFSGNVLSTGTAVPMQVGNLVRYQYETGKEAMVQIRQLHAKDIAMKSAYVSHYRDGSTVLTAWVADAENPGEAKALVDQMTAQIEKGQNKMFTDLKRQDVNGLAVYTVVSGSEPHYYYQMGSKIVWLGVEGPSPAQLLTDAIATFK